MPCIHGFEPGDCLICSTLDGDAGGAWSTKTRTKPATDIRPATAAPPVSARPDAVYDRPSAGSPTVSPRTRTHGRTFLHVIVALVLIVAAVLAFGLTIDIVRGIIHLLELAVVGCGAALIGYGVGRVHGRRRRS